MQLLNHVWTAVTTIAGVLTFSSWSDTYIDQKPLDESPLTSSSRPVSPLSGHKSGDLVFQPPGTPTGSSFLCDYSSMGEDWESCIGTPGCWLRNTAMGEQFNIGTDYETLAPTGISRHYKIDLADGVYDADGLVFSDAKFFGLYAHPDDPSSSEVDYTYPGPWIQACWGDRIVVNVTNTLEFNGTSVHWHGIRQLNSTEMDGVNGVTQCPIAPKDYFVYDFAAIQYGSSWYHSHYSVQYADGAVGPMTIHGPTSASYDDDMSPPLIITDWGHNSAFNALITQLEQPDILVNGHGNITRFSGAAATSPIQPAYNTTVTKGLKYLMRIINTSFATAFVFSVDNHQLTVIEADWVPIEPDNTTNITVGIGQRYDVILWASPLEDPQNPNPPDADGNYWMRTYISDCYGPHVKAPNNTDYMKTGILHYDGSEFAEPSTASWQNISTACRDEPYESLVPVFNATWNVGPPNNGPPAGEQFSVSGILPSRKEYPVANLQMNKTFLDTQYPIRVDYNDPTFFHLDNSGNWTSIWRVQPEAFEAPDWIYLVIEGGPREHPIHLHGHDFAILEQIANKTYDPSTTNFKLDNPPRRDVVNLPAQGYIVIAFKADNPGTWLVHFHIANHIAQGLGMQIAEDLRSAATLWPNNQPTQIEAHRVCDNWYSWSSNSSNWAPQPECTDSPEICFQNDSGV